MSTFKNWVYTRNPFTRALKVSFTRARKIVLGHTDKLEKFTSDPELNIVHQRIVTLSKTYAETYSLWQGAIASRMKCTEDLTNRLNELGTTLIHNWDIRIQLNCSRYTSDYQELMRGGRKEFQAFAIGDRIARVKTLGIQLKRYSNLNNLQEEVENFYKLLRDLRIEQQKWEVEVRTLSDTLQGLIPQLAKALYMNLSHLMLLYPESPNKIVQFFDMELIRSKIKTNDSTFSLLEQEGDIDEGSVEFPMEESENEGLVTAEDEDIFSG